MIVATPSTLYIGLLAGFLGVATGTALALIAAYNGGPDRHDHPRRRRRRA